MPERNNSSIPSQNFPLVSLHGGHTLAADGSSTAEEMVKAACEKKMQFFGLSEHFYRPKETVFKYDHESDDSDLGANKWPDHSEEVVRLKNQLSKDHDTKIAFGAEVEYLQGYEDWTKEEVAKWPLDYVILSVHFLTINNEIIPFDYNQTHWNRAKELCGGEVGLYNAYLDHVLEALDWNIGDILGHLDVIKLYSLSKVEDESINTRLSKILDRCKKKGMILDLNARGLLKPYGEIYPSFEILKIAAEKGVGIIPGDDSHAPDQVGLNIGKAMAIAKEAGYERITLPASLGGNSWAI